MAGGAISGEFCSLAGAVIRITGSVFYGCFAQTGGTMEFKKCSLILQNSILKGNWAKSSNGGISLYSMGKLGTTGKKFQDKEIIADIRNSLFANNSAPVLEISASKIALKNITLNASTIFPRTQVKLSGKRIRLDET